jgi:hypothetical protein
MRDCKRLHKIGLFITQLIEPLIDDVEDGSKVLEGLLLEVPAVFCCGYLHVSCSIVASSLVRIGNFSWILCPDGKN